MLRFQNDYSEGAHPNVLRALCDTNLCVTAGYGLDDDCRRAADAIRARFACPDADVHFLVGGTQTNQLAAAAFLRPWEAMVAADTGHINVHETGAIEATGHKVCTVESPDGKLTPALVESVLAGHNGTEHMVLPRMVYISDTTEIGTVYTRAELAALRQCCDVHGLFLYLDGARLGSALTSPDNDLTLPDLAALTHAFTIGGTKNGALFGEAVVLTVPCPHFRWHIKQRGGMLAKGRLLGVQFQALLKDDLYFDIGRHANDMAFRLRVGFKALGYEFPVPSPSNQQFPVMKIQTAEKLAAMGFEFQVERVIDEEHIMYRFVTSWATPESAIDDLLNALAQCQ